MKELIKQEKFSAKRIDYAVGGQPPVVLCAPFHNSQQESSIISATILPGRGMNTFQLTAFHPGFGIFDMLYAPALSDAVAFFDNSRDDFMGNRSFQAGGAIMTPFAGRLRGELLPDGKSLLTDVLDKKVVLSANWPPSRNSTVEKVAHHGLLLNKSMNKIQSGSDETKSFVKGMLTTGDYEGRWVGWSEMTIECTLTLSGFTLLVTIENTGNDDMPAAIGWHPYLTFPGNKRESIRLCLPADSRLEVNNYEDVFPTGAVIPVAATEYDFRRKNGKKLGSLYLDDCFTDLIKNSNGDTTVTLYDPEQNYGVQMTANGVVNAIQIYAPVDKNFIALEPQMNFADPFKKEIWAGRNTGMTILKPAEVLKYEVCVKLFKL